MKKLLEVRSMTERLEQSFSGDKKKRRREGDQKDIIWDELYRRSKMARWDEDSRDNKDAWVGGKCVNEVTYIGHAVPVQYSQLGCLIHRHTYKIISLYPCII